MGKIIELYDVWIQQELYNREIFRRQQRTSAEWMINYILGAHSELSELLDETSWKTHRVHSVTEFGPNVIEELTDITKYVFSMWQMIGATPQDMIYYTYQKGRILEQLLRQEGMNPPVGEKIVMLDLDGTVADFRQGFLDWLSQSPWKDSLRIAKDQVGLHLDLNNQWDFREYEEAKLDFEANDGYSLLPVVKRIRSLIRILRLLNWKIIVYTARPYHKFKRIWGDTWTWLENNGVIVDELYFGYESRIAKARDLAAHNTVVAIEDDPTLIARYDMSGIHVFVSPQPYNEGIFPSQYVSRLSDEQQLSDQADLFTAIAQEKSHV